MLARHRSRPNEIGAQADLSSGSDTALLDCPKYDNEERIMADSSPAEIADLPSAASVLAVLVDQRLLDGLSNAGFSVRRANRFSSEFLTDDIGVVVYDSRIGDGWAIDNATAVANSISGKAGLIVLCANKADVIVLERYLGRHQAWAIVPASLKSSDLIDLVRGVAAYRRIQQTDST